MIKSLFTYLCILVTSIYSLPASAETWVVQTGSTFPPYNFMQEDSLTGIDVDITNEILHKMDITPEFEILPWKRIVKNTETGQTDMAVQFVATEERREKIILVGPFRSGETVFAMRKNANITIDVTNLDTLKNYTIGTVLGFAYTDKFDIANLTKDVAKDNISNLQKLILNRVDLIIGDKNTIKYIAKSLGVSNDIEYSLPLKTVPRYFGFPKTKKIYAERFEKTLNDMKESGEIQAIIDKWEN